MGREIEKGGTYKGIVSSIKEYGAFVEINGGQQGLLHISELSHDQVRKSLICCFAVLLSVGFYSCFLVLQDMFISRCPELLMSCQ